MSSMTTSGRAAKKLLGEKKEDLEEIREALRKGLELTAQKLRRKGMRLTVHCADIVPNASVPKFAGSYGVATSH